MNATELAKLLEVDSWYKLVTREEIASTLKKYELRNQEQRERIAKLEQALISIANEHVELSIDKIKWQCEDHIRWAKEALK